MGQDALVALLPESVSLLAAVFLIAMSAVTSAISAAFGLGGGVAMLLALLMVASPAAALPVHGIIQIGSNVGRAYLMREHIMRPLVWWFVPGAIIGIFLASQIFIAINISTLQLLLAAFILWSVWAPKIRGGKIANFWFSLVGAVSSFCTLFLGATGPLLAVFLNPSRFSRDATVATHATCMTIQHALKVVAFGFLGFVFAPWLPLLVCMTAAGFLGTFFGVRALRSIPEAVFRQMFKGVLTLLALRLVYIALA